MGSFVVFLTLAVCLGPSDPTFLVDHLLAKCCPAVCGRDFEIQGEQEEDSEIEGDQEEEGPEEEEVGESRQ